jgi:type II secretory pathway component PulM
MALALAGAVVLTAVIYQVHDFIEHDSKRLAIELPRKKTTLAAMQHDAEELGKLRGVPGLATTPGAQALAAVRAAAEARGLKLSLLPEGESIRVEGLGEQAELLAWLAEVAEQDGFYPTSMVLRRDVGSTQGQLAVVGRLENVLQ